MTSLLVLANRAADGVDAAKVVGALTAWADRSLTDASDRGRRADLAGDGSLDALIARIRDPDLVVETVGGQSGRRSSPRPPSGPRPTPPRDLVGQVRAGHLLLNVGRFADLAAVAKFCDLLRGMPGARDVVVTGFSADRAEIELSLTDPVALGREIRAASPVTIVIAGPAHDRVTINLDGAPRTAHRGRRTPGAPDLAPGAPRRRAGRSPRRARG